MSRKYDLTPSMAPFMDVHMVNSLLDHVREVSSLNLNPVMKHTNKRLCFSTFSLFRLNYMIPK
jgi:hypothetical protein